MLDRHLAAEAADRHRAPARRPNYFRAAAVAVALAARAATGPWTAAACSPAIALVEGGARARLWAATGARGAGAAGVPRRLDQQQLRRRGLPGFSALPGAVDTGRGLPGCLRAVARPGHQLCRRRARSPGARGHPFHAPARRRARHAAAAAGGASPHSAGLGRGARWAGLAVLAALALQLSIGVFMVLRAFPLPLAAAHNAGAALLVAATVLLNRRLRPVADFRCKLG